MERSRPIKFSSALRTRTSHTNQPVRDTWPVADSGVRCAPRSDRVPGYLKRASRCSQEGIQPTTLCTASRKVTFLVPCTLDPFRRRSFRAGKTACRPPLYASFHRFVDVACTGVHANKRVPLGYRSTVCSSILDRVDSVRNRVLIGAD